MKVSNTPTNHIFMKAWTVSEFKCDFAIITLDENTPTYKNFIERVKEKQELIKPILEKSKDFVEIYFSEQSGDIRFYEESEQIDISFLEEKNWAFVSISEEEIKNLTLMERQWALYTPNIVFTYDGYFYIKAIGDLPEENYYTEEVKTEEFINSFL